MATANPGPAAPDLGVHDRDLDIPRAASRRGRRLAPSLHEYQRLVANPFLAVFGMVVWFAIISEVVGNRRLDLFFPALASLILVYFLFQFHCLDCGATGRLRGWRTHSCASVQARRLSGRPRRFRGPSPTAQTLLWFYGLITFALIGSIFAF
jgi:hypothetical protein